MTNPDTTWNAIAALTERDARIAQLEAENAMLRESERAAVVAWLRNRDEPGAEYLATWIEAGDHLT